MTTTTYRKVIPNDVQDSSHKAHWSIGYLQAILSELDRAMKQPLYEDPVRQMQYMKEKISSAVKRSDDIEHDLRIP